MFKLVRLCLYLRLCCVNYSLEVLRGRRVSVFACHALDSFDAISQCVHHFVGVCDGGIGDAFVLELHDVGRGFALGVFYVAIMCAIVCVFLASGYEWVAVMHEIPISSAQTMTSLPYPRTQ